MGLLWVATAAGANAPDPEARLGLGAFLFKGEGSGISAMFFAVGSTLFCYLLLRGRMIPVAMAWLGVVASLVVVVALPLELAGVMKDNWFLWMPLLVFELSFAFWLLFKGVVMPPERLPPAADLERVHAADGVSSPGGS